jgi:uncharacterized membrane protein
VSAGTGPAGGPRPQRRAYVDWARGVAVLLMIEAHTADAWTRLNVRRTIAFRDATILGGFAAPLFLWLAGLAVVLAATRTAERGGSRRSAVEMICRRGLEIFILAFLFRVQGFIVTPGSHVVTIFRVDILNIMGPSIVVAGLVWGLARTAAARVLWYGAIASAIAMLTPIVRDATLVDALPVWFQWHLRPAGELTTFTLLPWAGFVFAGGAVGALIAAARDERSERRLHAILAGVGATLVALGFYTAGRPSLYHASSFWTSSPTWFAIRVGIVTMALSAIYALGALSERTVVALRGLERLGRSSLFVYWVHVELVYGYASWLWRHRLPLWGTAIAFCVFCAAMYWTVVLRDRFVDYWRTRPRGQLISAASNS